MGNLGRLRISQKKYDAAAKLFRKRYDMAPHPENLYPLGEALEKAGQRAAARKIFAEFERKARAESASIDNANRELILYHIDHVKKPAEALRLARREMDRRQDVFTLDAYAWALYANGHYRQAREQIERLLSVGVRDATILYHAGMIARRAGDHAAARRYLHQAVDLNSIVFREGTGNR